MAAPLLTDLHCHLIHGVDDGPRDIAHTQAMLRLAADNGVDTVCCTSHAMPSQKPFPLDVYEAHLDEAQAWADREGLRIRLLPGSEIFMARNLPDLLRDGAVPTLNGTSNVLLEFNPDTKRDPIFSAVRQLGNAGFTAVIAHAERYDGLRRMDDIAALRTDLGAVIQVNAGSILHPRTFFHKRWIRRLLSRGLCDIVASDAHDDHSRPCRMRAVYDLLVSEYGPDTADALCVRTPRMILGLDALP